MTRTHDLGPDWNDWADRLIEAVEPLGAVVHVYPSSLDCDRVHGFVVEIPVDKTGERPALDV